jgi:hypothetical protein
MLTPKIEYVDMEVVLPPPVKKQVWDGEKFVPMTLFKKKGCPGTVETEWLYKTYGSPGTYIKGSYWDYSRAGNFTVMDEKVYTWFQMKWANK